MHCAPILRHSDCAIPYFAPLANPYRTCLHPRVEEAAASERVARDVRTIAVGEEVLPWGFHTTVPEEEEPVVVAAVDRPEVEKGEEKHRTDSSTIGLHTGSH